MGEACAGWKSRLGWLGSIGGQKSLVECAKPSAALEREASPKR